jgi:hypothetical protein
MLGLAVAMDDGPTRTHLLFAYIRLRPREPNVITLRGLALEKPLQRVVHRSVVFFYLGRVGRQGCLRDVGIGRGNG